MLSPLLPRRRWVAAQPHSREGTVSCVVSVGRPAGLLSRPWTVLVEPAVPSPGTTVSFSSGPPQVKHSGVQAHDGLPDTLWLLPRNSWAPRAGPRLCGQRPVPKHLIQGQAAPLSPGSPGNPAPPPEPPSGPLEPRGPVLRSSAEETQEHQRLRPSE